MTDGIVLMHESDDDCAVRFLHTTVQTAVHDVLRTDGDLAGVNHVLATVLDAVTPIYPQLEAMAQAQPAGPVAAVLLHLRSAFGHAASGRPEPAVSSVVTAAATTSRLEHVIAADTEGDDPALWR